MHCLNEKSVSKSQQKFMGMVHALQKGDISPSDVSQDVIDAAKSMKKKDAKDFASTKHDGLPNKVKEYSFIGDKDVQDVDDDDFPHGKYYRNESVVLKSSHSDTIHMLDSILPSMSNLSQDERRKIVGDLIRTLNAFYTDHKLNIKIQ